MVIPRLSLLREKMSSGPAKYIISRDNALGIFVLLNFSETQFLELPTRIQNYAKRYESLFEPIGWIGEDAFQRWLEKNRIQLWEDLPGRGAA